VWIALFKLRSPPRMSRWPHRVAAAGRQGLVPDSAANAASFRHRPGWENDTMT
jgi:hypothetical protein